MSASLDPDQLAAVESNAPFTLCCAGPGGGKTRVLVERIKWKINTGSHPRNIVAITFTNAGANELKKRLGGIKLGWCGTLHSWCFRLLQQRGSLIGYREGGINLLTEDLADELLMQSAATLRYKGTKKSLSEAKKPDAVLVHRHFQHECKRNNLVTYDGVLVDALKLIKSDEEGFDLEELLVDETQDSAEIDWEIYEDIGADSLFVVGDEKQSVYGFRNAYPKGFTDAATRARVIKLQRNYRSGSRITEAATRLISHNSGLIAAETVSVTGTEGFIHHDNFSDDMKERAVIASRIRSEIQPDHCGGDFIQIPNGKPTPPHGGVNPSEIAVLCRTNALAGTIRDSLRASGIPVAGSTRQQLPQDFGHALDVLSLFADPRSDVLAERVMKRLAPEKIIAAKVRAIERGSWLSDAAADLSAIPNRATYEISGLAHYLPMWRVDKETCDLIQQRIGLLPQPEPTLADLRHDLYDLARFGGEAASAETGVNVLTAHAAKGREFAVVLIPGLEDEDWPGKRESEEESRRLLFVAVTRAKHAVYLSSAGTRLMRWGGWQARTVSRFVKELLP
jgi:DNA helicase II / ATP-dependent DNA helicase PcrA